MYRYKRILVNLNMDDGDAKLLQHANKISNMANSEKIYVIYTEQKFDVPKELVKEYPQLTESIADFARDRIGQLVEENIDYKNRLEIVPIVEEGQPLDTVLKQVRLNGVDLILYSTSKDEPDSAKFATKLARKAPCSVLVIPQESEFSLDNAAVSVDFSEFSEHATDAALAFTKAANAEKLNLLHVYQVPTGYHKTGKTYDEFAKIMKGHAEKKYDEFKSKINSENIEIIQHYLLSKKTAKTIQDFVQESNISFLAVGARGRGAGASVMLGSVSEKLIENLDIPVLAVKKKGSGLNILNALFN